MAGSTQSSALIEERLSKALYFLGLMEKLVHDRKIVWSVRVNDAIFPAEVVVRDERIGVQVCTMWNSEDVTGVPVLLCNGREVMFHSEMTLPSRILEFTWWFDLVPEPV